jgi:hypothetical protein
MTYNEWIRIHVQNTHRTCREVTQSMAEAFPDLKRIRGHYCCPVSGTQPHWWLIDSQGSIVDPTANQFPSRGTGDYVEYAGPEPTGKCLDCGELVYTADLFCDDTCRLRTLKSMGF